MLQIKYTAFSETKDKNLSEACKSLEKYNNYEYGKKVTDHKPLKEYL